MTRLPSHYAAARNSYFGETRAGAQDFANSFRQTGLWSVLAWNDILARYRGSLLGPFWLTISTAAFVGGVGLLYAGLLHQPTATYIPYMATGVVIWNFMAAMTSEGGDAFVQGAQIIRQTAIPLPLFIWRVVFRNILVFAHQIVVIFVVAVWFHYLLKINLPMAFVGFLLVVFNMSWVSFCAAIVAARFRDIPQVIATVLQLMFFITPVIWPVTDAQVHSLWVTINPAAHMLLVTRNPLLGLPAPLASQELLLGMGCAGWLFTFGVYSTVRRRIVHYL